MNNIVAKRPTGYEEWETSVPAEVVERAKKALVDNYSEFRSTANFIGVGLDDQKVSVRTSQYCHAQMSSIGKSCRVVLATENATSRRVSHYKSDAWLGSKYGKFTKELVRPFLKWFLYQSPYGFFILNRDDFEHCENYGFVLAGDVATTLVQSACIVSRHFQEVTPRAFEEFNKLVDRGIDGFVAYQICFNSVLSVFEKDCLLDKHVFGGYGSHRVSYPVVPEQMLNYYRGKVQNPYGETYQDSPTVSGSSRLFISEYTIATGAVWMLQNYRKNNADFHNFLLEKEGKMDKRQIYRPPNPFVKKTNEISEHVFTYEQAVTVVADYIQEFITKELSTDE